MVCFGWWWMNRSWVTWFLFSSTSDHKLPDLKSPNSVCKEFEASDSFKCVITCATIVDSKRMLWTVKPVRTTSGPINRYFTAHYLFTSIVPARKGKRDRKIWIFLSGGCCWRSRCICTRLWPTHGFRLVLTCLSIMLSSTQHWPWNRLYRNVW